MQPAWVVNYPGADVGWTRISEYKHSPNQPPGAEKLPGTVVYKVSNEIMIMMMMMI